MKNYAVNHGTLITTYNYAKIIEQGSKEQVEKVKMPLDIKNTEKGYQKVKKNIKQGRK